MRHHSITSSISDVSEPGTFPNNESSGSNYSGSPGRLSNHEFSAATNISTPFDIKENSTSHHFSIPSNSHLGQTSTVGSSIFPGSHNYHSQPSPVQFSATNPFLPDFNDSTSSQEFEGFGEKDLRNLAHNIQYRWTTESTNLTDSTHSFANIPAEVISSRNPGLEPESSEPSNLQNVLHRKRIDKTINQTSKIPIRTLTVPTTAQTFTTSSISSIGANVMTSDELSNFIHQSRVTPRSFDSPGNRSTPGQETGYYLRKSRIPFKLRSNSKK